MKILGEIVEYLASLKVFWYSMGIIIAAFVPVALIVLIATCQYSNPEDFLSLPLAKIYIAAAKSLGQPVEHHVTEYEMIYKKHSPGYEALYGKDKAPLIENVRNTNN